MARINRASGETDPLQWHKAPVSAERNIEARFMIGRDRMGRWIVKDAAGRLGGIFVNESAALHFAREAANYDASQVCKAPEGQTLELKIPSGLRSQSIH
ncbi:hypothetical protein [Rhizobium mesoamericanum]|uniref:hypothetical protein n=1 Tax=Rhizobium mesoamericanum TaxID=1079800 RepID=UPI001F37C962|nr:hypothetical protein [Rhizobium mesoamericanum]